jgi:hypothetical protein
MDSPDKPPEKPRSCIVCRNRKVRCDKQSPCSNCRRGNIPCTYPTGERPPRWIRRLDRLTEDPNRLSVPSSTGGRPNVNVAMDRLHNLEHLVKELRGQLELAQGQGSATGSGPGTAAANSPAVSSSSRHAEQYGLSPVPQYPQDTPSPYGRLVQEQGATESHYVGSAFWSRIVDEVSGDSCKASAIAATFADLLTAGGPQD